MAKQTMRKKGELQYLVLIDIVHIAIILGLLIFFMKDIREDTFFAQSYMARDIALTMESAQGPGIMNLTYNQMILGEFSYYSKENRVHLFREDKERSVYYPYYRNNLTKFIFNDMKNPQEIHILSCYGDMAVTAKGQGCLQSCPKPAGDPASLVLVNLNSARLTDAEAMLKMAHSDKVIDTLLSIQTVSAGAHRKEQAEDVSKSTVLAVKSGDSSRVRFAAGDADAEAMACSIAAAFALRGIDIPKAPMMPETYPRAVFVELDTGIEAAEAAVAINGGLESYYG
jgi:hypothetical protein